MRWLIPSTRRGALWRFTFAAVLIIGFAAAATAVAGLLQFKQLASELSQTPPISLPTAAIASPGKPQTILLIGSDHRAGEPFSSANTDSMMLVRLNASSQTINLVSVPRDLQVNVPEGGGVVVGKLNSAYSVGGQQLLIKILKQQVFPGLQVNHVIDINFGGFERLVDAIGCVYSDVDHRYYNNTNLTNYSSIDIQPGYQKLCDANALAFVRFRHTDTDIVRNARQQDFLRWAKDQYGFSRLIANKNELLSIFGANAQTDQDLHTTDGLINLFNLVAFSDGHTLKQIPFPAILLPCTPTSCFVTATPGGERRAFIQFMAPSTTAQAHPTLAAPRRGPPAGAAAAATLTGDATDGEAQAQALGNLGFPIYYPRTIAAGSAYCADATGNCPVEIPSPGSYPRKYRIHGAAGQAYEAYRMTLEINPSLGEYYGIQGTTWLSPPLLASPSETRYVEGKQLLLFANGGKITVVGWRTPRAVYWVSNTLTDNLSNQQMIAIASSFTKAA